MVTLPDEYVITKFCQYSGYPKHNKRANTWAGGCPICREGSSWGKKRRLYYKLDKNYIFCFNCGWKGSTLDFVKHVTGLTFQEIVAESSNFDTNNITEITTNKPPVKQTTVPSLPHDSINLLDSSQVEWWLSSNDDQSSKKVVKDALDFIHNRLIDSAINRPDTIWLSLTDFTHKNRIVLPFYSTSNKILFYQSRAIYNEPDRPNYLSKSNNEKSIFNINNIDSKLDSMFLFEGPIDSCFVKNGVAVAGITNGHSEDLNTTQRKQLDDFRLYQKIWVLDSQWLDDTSLNKTKLLIENGNKVFIWPENIGRKYKDLNELCMAINKPGIGYKFIEKHSHDSLKAGVLLQNIKTNR